MNFTKENKNLREKVFFVLIDEVANNSIIDKFYSNIIKNYLKKHLLIYYRESNTVVTNAKDISQIKSNQIVYENYLDVITNINIIFKVNNENNFMTDLIVYIVKGLYEGFPSNSNYNSSNNNANIILSSSQEIRNSSQNYLNLMNTNSNVNTNMLSNMISISIFFFLCFTLTQIFRLNLIKFF